MFFCDFRREGDNEYMNQIVNGIDDPVSSIFNTLEVEGGGDISWAVAILPSSTLHSKHLYTYFRFFF